MSDQGSEFLTFPRAIIQHLTLTTNLAMETSMMMEITGRGQVVEVLLRQKVGVVT